MPPSVLIRALESVYQQLEQLNASPVVADGLAVAYWGHPRSTQDIDLAVLVADESKFETELRQANMRPTKSGKPIDLGFVKVFQWKLALVEDYMDCEVDFLISDSSYHQQAIQRALHGTFTGVDKTMRVLDCEDLLLFKAASGRLIDLADTRVLVDLHREALDVDYLNERAADLGLPTDFWLRD